MRYSEALQYLDKFINYEDFASYPYQESLVLERVRLFLAAIGNPQDTFKSVHVAGSKGKGSTCALLTYILREAGYSVGLYTSPHLVDFRERIRILKPQAANSKAKFEGLISRKDLASLVSRLKPHIERYNKVSKYGALTFFEVITSIAFQYFKEEKVDIAVLETGLGGRLDATNVVSPLVSVITPVSYEHTHKLGKTLAKISGEKAGIIKGGIPLVCAPQEREALKVIRKRCKINSSPLFPVNALPVKFKNARIGLIGGHQRINAAASVKAAELLKGSGFKISDSAIRQGLARVRWPGRCEVISKKPLVILDGAQNAASAKALKKAVEDNFKYKKLILVLGISSDKDIKGICAQLKSLSNEVILTKADTPRATPVNKLAVYFENKPVRRSASVGEAMVLARRLSSEKDLVLVTGSLFVVGEVKC